MLLDSKQRTEATNPSLSFIVQAPAGSGKTEILTQRYLRLLSTVTAPEQIIALTFTRKAASEMRERVLLSLQQAANNKEALSPHQQITFNFAREALHRDACYQWNLLQQSNRLKIITIDALCQTINQAIPLLEKQIAYSQITDKADSFYVNAGRRCIQFALATPEYQEAIKTLLLHVDNRQDRLLDLFKAMLSQREQWLFALFQARAQEKSTFEQALRVIEQHELNRFKQVLPMHLAQELTLRAQELALIENNPTSPRYLLKDWHDFNQITQEIACSLSKLLLTNDGNFRKSFDHHVGLSSTSCSPEDYKRLKNASKQLLNELNEYPDFLEALLQVSSLPNPHYDLEQWGVLQALFSLLPLLVSHLHVLFSEHNEVDFTTISQQALQALGDADEPTDLALYLDHTLHHILVDEFQDTSITQFELLTKLVQGWQEGDGRTLFLVGDPMQSIYRFRQAEVGLFFRAKEQGIGLVKLKSLELSCNFRSSQKIVDWVNNQFTHIFPSQVDIASGAVSFHPSMHLIPDNEQSCIQAMQCNNKEHEARKLVHLVHYELNTYPDQNIAILVRSRTQLIEIIRLLRQQQIPYQGTDITLLANLSHIRDVWSLTQALLFPANRLSWLSVLHSPYCGLPLNDIHVIAHFNKKKSIYYALLHLNKIQGLSEEGKIRAGFFIDIMHKALIQRYEIRLSDWIIRTLKELHIKNILTSNQLRDLNQFWALLDRYEQHGRLADKKEFLSELNKLYSQEATPSRLQIMTIHKSKGLEYDAVILPGLGSRPSRGHNPMLRWLNLPTPQNGNLLLMSPIQAAHREQCALYEYLAHIEEIKENYEAQRLLYVAVTRAKSRLYLLDYAEKKSLHSFRNLLKRQEFTEDSSEDFNSETNSPLPKLVRLPLHYYLNQNQDTKTADTACGSKTSAPCLSLNIPRLIGIVTHQLLQWICTHHPTQVTEIPWDLARNQLQKLGFNETMQQDALLLIQKQITSIFQDKMGSWIIAPHLNEQNEYELLIENELATITRIIDRIFIHQGAFWIIDFKTGKEDVVSLTKHQQQLNEYGYYLSRITTLPIHCGLYYLSNNHWISWHYIENNLNFSKYSEELV